MLGLLLIYFIGKWFYNLAEKHNKNKWLFAVLSIVVYYGMMFVGGIIIGLLAVTFNWRGLFDLPDVVLGLIALPFGLLSVWVFHTILRKNWEKAPVIQDDLLDSSSMSDLDLE